MRGYCPAKAEAKQRRGMGIRLRQGLMSTCLIQTQTSTRDRYQELGEGTCSPSCSMRQIRISKCATTRATGTCIDIHYNAIVQILKRATFARPAMRNITVKQAERWLEKIRETDPGVYKDLGRCLRKYDQTSDQLECFVKMNEALYSLPLHSQELNSYLEQGNQLIVNEGLQERLNAFLNIARNTKYELFRQIVQYVNKITTQDHQILDLPNQKAIEFFKAGLMEIVSGNHLLELQLQKMLPLAQEAIKQLDLRHLSTKSSVDIKDDPDYFKAALARKQKRPSTGVAEHQNERTRQILRSRATGINFLSICEQKVFIKQLQKKMDSRSYSELIKVILLYHHNIISRIQLCSLLEPVVGEEFNGICDIVEAREVDRRRASSFKPLSDIDFHILGREAHSYVQMPFNYPHFVANRATSHQQVLNSKWVSVPRGSEVTFNVRVKNIYEVNLNKCEDQRYEFDLILCRLNKTLSIFSSIIEDLQQNQQKDVSNKLARVISLGVLQMLYRNASKEQKDALEDLLNSVTLQTVRLWQERIRKVMEELQQYKKLYATKTWNQVAHKNFYKSLDFKNHEFKNLQKLKLRAQTFIQELNSQVKYLQSRGSLKMSENPFKQKKQFFSVLNSFESNCRKQQCQTRKASTPCQYDLQSIKSPSLAPAMILAFESEQVLSISTSILNHFVEYTLSNQLQRGRCKATLKEVMTKLLRIQHLRSISLHDQFVEDKFLALCCSNPTAAESSVDKFLMIKTEPITPKGIDQQAKIPFFNSLHDFPNEFNFEPPKAPRNTVFYGSESFYVFLRFFYCLYQRVMRMTELAQSPNKIRIFQTIYLACIRTKENGRFEECLNALFKQYSYLFMTFYKIVEGAAKSLSSISLSPVQSHSFNLIEFENEEVYLLLLNRHILGMQSSPTRLIRANFEHDSKLVYIHSISPYYRCSEEPAKQLNKKRLDMPRRMEEYSQESIAKCKQIESWPVRCKNNQQYYFEGSSSRLVALPSLEDIILGAPGQRTRPTQEWMKVRRMRAAYKF